VEIICYLTGEPVNVFFAEAIKVGQRDSRGQFPPGQKLLVAGVDGLKEAYLDLLLVGTVAAMDALEAVIGRIGQINQKGGGGDAGG
jgi:hypothetical protein